MTAETKTSGELRHRLALVLDPNQMRWVDRYANTLAQERALAAERLNQRIGGRRSGRTWAMLKTVEAEYVPLQARVKELEEALREAEHDLVTLGGLQATDRPWAYSEALGEGCDPNGAWDCFAATLFTVDVSKTLARIRAALEVRDANTES